MTDMTLRWSPALAAAARRAAPLPAFSSLFRPTATPSAVLTSFYSPSLNRRRRITLVRSVSSSTSAASAPSLAVDPAELRPVVHTAMMTALGGLAYALSTTTGLDRYLGYFLPLPIVVAAGEGAGREGERPRRPAPRAPPADVPRPPPTDPQSAPAPRRLSRASRPPRPSSASCRAPFAPSPTLASTARWGPPWGGAGPAGGRGAW